MICREVTVLMNSFQSRVVKLKVAKKPEMRNEELLPQDGGEDGGGNGWFSSITNQVKSVGDMLHNFYSQLFSLRDLRLPMLKRTRVSTSSAWLLAICTSGC